MLGHDLRNPLTSIAAGARMLPKADSKPVAAEILGLIQKSVARMSALIDDVLDFARGRLGSGVAIDRAPLSLQPILEHVISELQSSHPDRTINVEFALTEPANCDGGRIGQLFSNLLGNALTHGAAGSPIGVRAATQNQVFELSVANAGEPIPAAAMAKLFQPFYRGSFTGRCRGWASVCSSHSRSHGRMAER